MDKQTVDDFLETAELYDADGKRIDPATFEYDPDWLENLETDDEPTQNNCGTGDGGFQPGNTCASRDFGTFFDGGKAETEARTKPLVKEYTKQLKKVSGSDEQTEAVKKFSMHAYKRINAYLKNDGSEDFDPNESALVTKHLDDYIHSNAGRVTPPTLYRGLHPKDGKVYEDLIKVHESGKDAIVKLGPAFQSMTSDMKTGIRFAGLHAPLPGSKSDKGVPSVLLEVSSRSAVPTGNVPEFEYMAPRNSGFRVKGVERGFFREDTKSTRKFPMVKIKLEEVSTSEGIQLNKDYGMDIFVLNNCGIGPEGFEPGNDCAKGGDGGAEGEGGTSTKGVKGALPGAKIYKDDHAREEKRKKTSKEIADSFTGKAANPDGQTTYDQHRTPDGKWTPERQEMHKKIIEDFLKEATPVDEPNSYMTGGGPASGKSVALKMGFMPVPENHVAIDPDAIKNYIPEYRRGLDSKDPKVAEFAHEESSYLGKQIMSRAVENGYNTLLDGTGNSAIEDLTRKVAQMKQGGRKAIATYVTVDTDIAQARNLERAEKTGRFVPEAFLRACHASVSNVLPKALSAGLFDEVNLIDTSSGKAVRVLSAKGNQVEVHDNDRWEAFLSKATEAEVY